MLRFIAAKYGQDLFGNVRGKDRGCRYVLGVQRFGESGIRGRTVLVLVTVCGNCCFCLDVMYWVNVIKCVGRVDMMVICGDRVDVICG